MYIHVHTCIYTQKYVNIQTYVCMNSDAVTFTTQDRHMLLPCMHIKMYAHIYIPIYIHTWHMYILIHACLFSVHVIFNPPTMTLFSCSVVALVSNID